MTSYLPTYSLFCLKIIALSEFKSSLLSLTIRQHKMHQLSIHPQIVKYFFSAYDSNHIYLGMQYMQSEILGQHLKQQILRNMSQQGTTKAKINETITTQISKVNKIRKILYEITSALKYLHQKSIIRRDLKLDHFLCHMQDIYKLGEFGSAGLEGEMQYVGTLNYAAPEILTQSTYNNKVEIWSLGCIAYQLDVGRQPFFHINQQWTKKRAINGDYDKVIQFVMVNQKKQLKKCQQQTFIVVQVLSSQSNINSFISQRSKIIF